MEIETINLPDDYEGKVIATLMKYHTDPQKFAGCGVLYIHGYLDYFFQEHMADYFVSRGKNFYAVDLRKYGRSLLPNQHPYYCKKLTEYFPEIDYAIKTMLKEGNVDITLIGHSTGGLISIMYGSFGPYREFITRMILNSPFLDFNTNWFRRRFLIPIVGEISRFYPYAGKKNEISPNYFRSIHRSEHGEWDFNTDYKPAEAPRLYFAWLRAVYKAQWKIRKKRYYMPFPIMVMCSDRSSYCKKWSDIASESDAVLNVKHIRKYAQRLGADVRLVEIKGGLHDLVLSKPEVREHVLATMNAFIDRYFP